MTTPGITTTYLSHSCTSPVDALVATRILEIGATKARSAADKQAFFESGRRSAGAVQVDSRA